MNIRKSSQRLNSVEVLIVSIVSFNLIYWILDRLGLNIMPYIAFSPALKASLLKPWSYITYIFLHKSLWHLLMNMLVLWFLGKRFMTCYGFRTLLALFIMGGIAGAISYQLIYVLLHSTSMLPLGLPLLGSSASIYCLIFAHIFREGEQKLRINQDIEVSYIHLAYGFLALVFIFLFFSKENIGGELAHIGGALLGILYAYILRKYNKDISEPFAKAIDWLILKWQELIYKLGLRREGTKSKINISKLEEIERKMKYSGFHSLNSDEKKELLDK